MAQAWYSSGERADSEADRVGDQCPVVAVIPAFDEARFIASVVISVRQFVDHVIVVDDGSDDGTALLARCAGADVVHLPENRGKGAALNAGFERARELQPRVVVTLDADAQHAAAEIPAVIQPIMAGLADVVIGSRFLGIESKIPSWRRLGQHALTHATNAASGISTSDSQSGFRAFSTHALHQLSFRTGGLALESEMQFQVQRAGLRLIEVPISVQYRDGNKRNPVVHGVEVVEAILSLVTQRRPLLVLSLLGMFIMLGGFAAGLYVVYIIGHDHAVPLGTAILSACLLIIGHHFVIAGVILHTLERFVTRILQELGNGL